MRICLVGPGIMPIPPTGWGAVEILIWDYAQTLQKQGHDVRIVNTQNKREIIDKCNEFNADITHIQYDDFWSVIPNITSKIKAITSHYGYITQVGQRPITQGYVPILDGFKQIISSSYIFCLSPEIKQAYIRWGLPDNKLVITPNGARPDLFRYDPICELQDQSIFLAKIDYRKRQRKAQVGANVYFVGNIDRNNSGGFVEDNFYHGEWNKQRLYNELTRYANLVLLSDGEADPLVTKEAMMAGLGLVLSEYSTANLDLSLPFIDVIPESRIHDTEYVKNVIVENRYKSIHNRPQIRKYAEDNFDWSVLVKKYTDMIGGLL